MNKKSSMVISWVLEEGKECTKFLESMLIILLQYPDTQIPRDPSYTHAFIHLIPVPQSDPNNSKYAFYPQSNLTTRTLSPLSILIFH